MNPNATVPMIVLENDHEQIHDRGYYYVIAPIGASASILFVIALLLSKMSSDESWQYPND